MSENMNATDKALQYKMKPYHFEDLRDSILKSSMKNSFFDKDIMYAIHGASNFILKHTNRVSGNIAISSPSYINKFTNITPPKISETFFDCLVKRGNIGGLLILEDVRAKYDGIIVTYTNNIKEGFINPIHKKFYCFIIGAEDVR
jgi:hypothetical protein